MPPKTKTSTSSPEEKKETYQPLPEAKEVVQRLYYFILKISDLACGEQKQDTSQPFSLEPFIKGNALENKKLGKNDRSLIIFCECMYQIIRNGMLSMVMGIGLELVEQCIIRHGDFNKSIFKQIISPEYNDVWNYLSDIKNEMTYTILQCLVLCIVTVNYDNNKNEFLNRLLSRWSEQEVEVSVSKENILDVLKYFIWLGNPSDPLIAFSDSNNNRLIKSDSASKLLGEEREKSKAAKHLEKIEFDRSVLKSTVLFVTYKLHFNSFIHCKQKNYQDNFLFLQNKLNVLARYYGVNDRYSLLFKEHALVSYHYICYIATEDSSTISDNSSFITNSINYLIADGNIILLPCKDQEIFIKNLINIQYNIQQPDQFKILVNQYIQRLFVQNNRESIKFILLALLKLTPEQANDYKVVISLCEFYFDLNQFKQENSFNDLGKTLKFIEFLGQIQSKYLLIINEEQFNFPENLIALKKALGDSILLLHTNIKKNLFKHQIVITKKYKASFDMVIARFCTRVDKEMNVEKPTVAEPEKKPREEKTENQRMQEVICKCAQDKLIKKISGDHLYLDSLQNNIDKFLQNNMIQVFPESVQIETCKAIVKLNRQLPFKERELLRYSIYLFLNENDDVYRAFYNTALEIGFRGQETQEVILIILQLYFVLKGVVHGKCKFKAVIDNIIQHSDSSYKRNYFWHFVNEYFNWNFKNFKFQFKSRFFNILKTLANNKDKYEFAFPNQKILDNFNAIVTHLAKALEATDLELADLKLPISMEEKPEFPQPVHAAEETQTPAPLKALPFKPSKALVRFDSHIDRCLNEIDVSRKDGNKMFPTFKTNLADFFDYEDLQSQKIIEFGKLFFRLLIRKEHADFSAFEKLQDELFQCLLKIKNEDKEAWLYIVNERQHMCFRLVSLQWAVYDNVHLPENSSFLKLFLDHDNNNVVMEYFDFMRKNPGLFADEEKGVAENILPSISNVLVKAKIILSSYSLRKSLPLLITIECPFSSSIIQHYFLALFILSRPDSEQDFLAPVNYIKKLAEKNYVIDYCEKKSGKANESYLYGIMQLIKNLQLFSNVYHDALGVPSGGHLKQIVIAVSKKYLVIFSNMDNTNVSSAIFDEFIKCFEYFIKNLDSSLLSLALDCAGRIIVKNISGKNQSAVLFKRIQNLLSSVDVSDLIVKDKQSYILFQNKMIDFSKKLGANKNKINDLKKMLRYDETHLKPAAIPLPSIDLPFSVCEEKMPKANPNANLESEIACLPVSCDEPVDDVKEPLEVAIHSFFPEREIPFNEAIISRSRIRKSILRLADEIFEITQHPLVVTGGALIYLLQGGENPKDHDVDVIIFTEMESFFGLWSLAHKSKYIPCSHHPFIETEIIDRRDLITIGMTCVKHEGNDPVMVDDTMQAIMATRDYKPRSLYMVLYPVEAESFKIKGFNGAVESVRNGYISYVHQDIFDDVTCFFHLVKLYCKHPTLKKDGALSDLLAEKQKICTYMFFDFISRGGLPSINTRINELFRIKTYVLAEVLDWFCELPIMEGMNMTGPIDFTILKETKAILADYVNIVRNRDYRRDHYYFPHAHSFYYFMYAHLYFSQNANEFTIRLYAKAIATMQKDVEAPEFCQNLGYIERNSPHDIPMEKHIDPNFLYMIYQIKSVYPASKMNTVFFQDEKVHLRNIHEVKQPLANRFDYFPSAVITNPSIEVEVSENLESSTSATPPPMAPFVQNENTLFASERRQAQPVPISVPPPTSFQQPRPVSPSRRLFLNGLRSSAQATKNQNLSQAPTNNRNTNR